MPKKEKLITAVYYCMKCEHLFMETWPNKKRLYPPETAKALGVPADSPYHPPCPKCGSLYYKRIK